MSSPRSTPGRGRAPPRTEAGRGPGVLGGVRRGHTCRHAQAHRSRRRSDHPGPGVLHSAGGPHPRRDDRPLGPGRAREAQPRGRARVPQGLPGAQLAGHERQGLPRPGARGRRRAGGQGPPTRPGRGHHGPHLLRVDPHGLRRLGGGPGRGPHLRDLLGRPGPVDPDQLRGAPGGGGERGHGDHGDRPARVGPRAGRPSGPVPGARGRPGADRGGQGGRGRRARPPYRDPDLINACHDRLHLGHHRPPQGHRAQPWQPGAPVRQHLRPRARGHGRPGGPPAAVPAPGARPGPLHGDRHRVLRGRCAGPCARCAQPGHRPGVLPPHGGAGGAPGLREDLQRGRCPCHRGQAEDLPHGRQDGHRLLPRPGHPGGPLPGAASPARRLRPHGLLQAARGAGREGLLRRLRWRTPGREARPLLPRCRCQRPGGLRPDRDHGPVHRQPSRRHPHRHGRPSPARLLGAPGRRRRGAHQGHRRLLRLPRRPRSHGGRLHRGRLAA